MDDPPDLDTHDLDTHSPRYGVVMTDDELNALFIVEPEQFVAARDAMVKRLKAEKRKDDAAVVGALRRPSPVVWAMNQVARRNPATVDELIRAGGAALRAQAALMDGGPVSALHEAVEYRRSVVAALVQETLATLPGKGSSGELGPQLRPAYEQVSVDAALSTDLRRGRLTVLPTRTDDDAALAALPSKTHLRLVPQPVYEEHVADAVGDPAQPTEVVARSIESAAMAEAAKEEAARETERSRKAAEEVAVAEDKARAQVHLARMEAAMAEAQESAADLPAVQERVDAAAAYNHAAARASRDAADAADAVRSQIRELEGRLAELVTQEGTTRSAESDTVERLATEQAALAVALERAEAAKAVLLEIARSMH